MNDNHLVPKDRFNGVIRMSDDADVVYLKSLDDPALTSTIVSLAMGAAAAVVIDDVVTPQVCAAVADLMGLMPISSYTVEPDFLIGGLPLFEAIARHQIEFYFEAGQSAQRELQRRISPLVTPDAQLRLMLDQQWPYGANLLRLDGRICPFGLLRKILPGNRVWPHTDNSDLDMPHPEFRSATTNLSWLAYLTDSGGGDLRIWPIGFETQDAIDRHRLMGHPYAVDVGLLPPPRVRLAPRLGRMVIFNAKFVHEVAAVTGSLPRISQSGFILFGDEHRPLSLYQ